jgi:hypothetical protein
VPAVVTPPLDYAAAERSPLTPIIYFKFADGSHVPSEGEDRLRMELLRCDGDTAGNALMAKWDEVCARRYAAKATP